VKRNWNWTKILLVISLGANLAVAGAVVGSVIAHRHGHDRHDAYFGGGMRPYIAALPESQRENVRNRLVRSRETIRMARQDIRNSEQAVRDAIAANPFDAKALGAAFAHQRAIYNGLAVNGHETLVSILSGMTDQERATYIEHLKSFRRGPEPAPAPPAN